MKKKQEQQPSGDIDYRKRCLVRNGAFDRIYYGIVASEYADGSAAVVGTVVEDIKDTFDHSAGRGRRSNYGVVAENERTRHYFTPGLGRHDEIALEKARSGSIRR